MKKRELLKILLSLWLSIAIFSFSSDAANVNPRKKRNKQEIKFRAHVSNNGDTSTVSAVKEDEEPSSVADAMAKSMASIKTETVRENSESKDNSTLLENDIDDLLAARVCPAQGRDLSKYTINSFWSGNYIDAYLCSMQMMERKTDIGLSSSILYFLTQTRFAVSANVPKVKPPSTEAPSIFSWEILGPFPVSKLEVDADPAFDRSIHNVNFDPILTILSMNSSSSKYYSELMPEGVAKWGTFNTKATNNQVDIRFATNWNELGNGLSNSAVFEFQGWARATTYAYLAGQYVLQCIGVHTVYLRNDNFTRILTGDVYQSGKIVSFVDLKIGPVGIVFPLRAVAQMSFSCSLRHHADGMLLMFPVSKAPDLLELEPESTSQLLRSDKSLRCAFGAGSAYFASTNMKTTIGLLLSNIFVITLQNPNNSPVSVDVQLSRQSQHVDATGANIGLRLANHNKATATQNSFGLPIVIAPGQVIAIPVELYSLDDTFITFPCKQGSNPIEFVVTPSKGQALKATVEFQCRRHNQSMLYTYLDHDGTASQAAFTFPLPDTPSNIMEIRSRDSVIQRKLVSRSANNVSPSLLSATVEGLFGTATERAIRSPVIGIDGLPIITRQKTDITGYESPLLHPNVATAGTEQAKSNETGASYPAFVTLHGTGLSATSQADAYKVMPPKASEYVFGVEGFFVVAPSRHGAHNWEAIGSLSAISAIDSLQNLLSHFPRLPQLLSSTTLPHDRTTDSAADAADRSEIKARYRGLIAGHSMGGHGAWQLAVNNPELALCTAAAASWIRKEEYGTANAFFDLDIQSSIVDPQLKLILEQAMSEFHVDRFVSNLKSVDVNIRVGNQDITTHPWYSRRMHRLLQRYGINSTIEELGSKQHWWWDTRSSNDGGALNDPNLQQFYRHCLNRFMKEYDANYPTCVASDARDSTMSASRHADKEVKPKSQRSNSKNSNNFDTVTAEQTLKSPSKGFKHWSACFKNTTTLSVVNPNSHSGLCGIRITSQFLYQQLSSVKIDCKEYSLENYHRIFVEPFVVHNQSNASNTTTSTNKRPNPQQWQTNAQVSRCILHTKNVRSLQIQVVNGSYFPPNYPNAEKVELLIDGHIINLDATNESKLLRICWESNSKRPYLCDRVVDPLEERTVETSGPVRQIYAKPWIIVYGTPQQHQLRHAMRDLAIYIANSNFAAHDTYVRVVSDVEYRSGGYSELQSKDFHNLMLIGGPTVNRVMRKTCSNSLSLATSVNSDKITKQQAPSSITKEAIELNCRSTVDFRLEGSDINDVDADLVGIKIGPYSFDEPDTAAIFTFPISRTFPPKKAASAGTQQLRLSEGGMGVCLHATSVQGFLHLSRLAWPVVPPMVRSPFANYIPDVMVVDGTIWRDGFGSVRLAGYWNASWGLDVANSFYSSGMK